MPPMKPCEMWCERGRQRRKTSYVRNIGWASFSCDMAGSVDWCEALDLELPVVGDTRSALRAPGARSHLAGLPARGGACGTAHRTAEPGGRRSGEVETAEDARGDRGLAGSTGSVVP